MSSRAERQSRITGLRFTPGREKAISSEDARNSISDEECSRLSETVEVGSRAGEEDGLTYPQASTAIHAKLAAIVLERYFTDPAIDRVKRISLGVFNEVDRHNSSSSSGGSEQADLPASALWCYDVLDGFFWL
jgi:hypothetical protein